MRPPLGIVIVSSLMILFGVTEVATAFSHDFVGITTSASLASTVAGAALGAFYLLAGILALSMKRWAMRCAIALLVADVVGRLGLVATRLYPLNSAENVAGIVGGTSIAAVFAIYLSLKVNGLFPSGTMVGAATDRPGC